MYCTSIFDVRFREIVTLLLCFMGKWQSVIHNKAPCRVTYTVYPKKYAHSIAVLCFVVVMQSFIMNSHEVLIHIHQGCFAGTGAIVRLPQCQWSKPDGYGKISQCITTTKHSKAKTVCIFLGIYCNKCITEIALWYSTFWASGDFWNVITYPCLDLLKLNHVSEGVPAIL